jgi:hypothetical protein
MATANGTWHEEGVVLSMDVFYKRRELSLLHGSGSCLPYANLSEILLMDIYLAIGFAPLVFGLFTISRFRALRYLVVIAGALALSGCLSLRLGGNDKPQPSAGQSAGPVDVANSMAEAPGS